MAGELLPKDVIARIEELKALGDLGEVEKAVSISKSLLDIANQDRDYRSRLITLWTSCIVPIASLLTVALTVYFQSSQLQTERDKTEDGRWHDVIGLTSKPTAEALTNPSFGTELGSFFKSSRYRAEAMRIAADWLMQLTDDKAFAQIYKQTFATASFENFALVAEMNAALTTKLNDIVFRCSHFMTTTT